MDYTRSSLNSNQYSQNSIIPNTNNFNRNNIPYAKPISSSNFNYNSIPNYPSNSNYYRRQYFPNSSMTNELPPIPRTPLLQNDTYKQAYDNCNIAKDMLQTRLNRLNYQKKLLGEIEHNPLNTNNNMNYESMYKLRTMGNARGKLSYPYNNNQLMEPIYYPLEMPLAGEPIALPQIEIGGSMRKKCKNGGLDIESLIPLLALLRKRRPQPAYNPPPQPQIIYPEPEPQKEVGYKKIGGVKKVQDVNKNTFIPETVKVDKKKKKLAMRRDWWKLCRDFVNVEENMLALLKLEIILLILELKQWYKISLF